MEMDAMIVPIVAGLIILAVIGLYGWSVIWAYRDAKAREKPALLVALLVALFSWPLSLLVWLVFRPKKSAEKAA